MSRKTDRSVSQEVLNFGEGLTIPEGYDAGRAKTAALRRAKRFRGIDRVNGLLRRNSGLFVPSTGTENSAIVMMPEVKAESEKLAAEERVKQKYAYTDVATSKVNLWKHFAGQRAHAETHKKYRSFRNESVINAARIQLRVADFGNVICRDAFTYDLDYRIDPEAHSAREDVLAYNSVLKYLAACEAFSGTNPALIDRNGRRKWPQPRNHNDYRARMERAHETMDPLAEDLFALVVDEAYWSHFSRNIFWNEVYDRHAQFMKDRSTNADTVSCIPLEAYTDSPEYYGLSVIN